MVRFFKELHSGTKGHVQFCTRVEERTCSFYPVTFHPFLQMHRVEHRTEGWKEEKWILHQPHLYLRQTGLENSFNFSQTHPLIWIGHVISLSIHPTCPGHKFSFSSPGRARQVAVSCGFKPQQGPLYSAPESASTGLFLSRLRADTCSHASIPLCIRRVTSQEGGIELAIAAAGCEGEPPRQKQKEAIRRPRVVLDAQMCC